MLDTLQTYDLLLPIVQAVNREIIVDEITDLTNNVYRLDTCNTLWVTKGYTVTIDAIDYRVTDIVPNESITITGTTLPTASSFLAEPFYFVHGTLRSTKNDQNNKNKFYDKYPILWLHDIHDERFDRNPENIVGRFSDCTFYALITSDNDKWQTTEHDKYAIKPMRNLVNAFIRALIASRATNLDQDETAYTHTVRDHARFGHYQTSGDNSGNTEKLFNDSIGGARLRLEIPFLRTFCCSDCCEQPALAGGVLYVNGLYITTIPSGGTYNLITPIEGVWLLLLNTWNDMGIWDDNQFWID